MCYNNNSHFWIYGDGTSNEPIPEGLPCQCGMYVWQGENKKPLPRFVVQEEADNLIRPGDPNGFTV